MEENIHTESCHRELGTETSGSENIQAGVEVTEASGSENVQTGAEVTEASSSEDIRTDAEAEKEENQSESEPSLAQCSPKALPAPKEPKGTLAAPQAPKGALKAPAVVIHVHEPSPELEQLAEVFCSEEPETKSLEPVPELSLIHI